MRASNEVLSKEFLQGASEWPKAKILDFLLYLIKSEFSKTFRFNHYQFSCPWRKITTKYLISKLLLVIKDFGVGTGEAVL